MEPIRSQTIHLSSLSLLLTAVLFVFAFFLSHSIADPIRRLRDYAMALGRGELIQRFDFKGSVELEDLSSSFNAMADEIGKREEALRRSEEKYRELVENANCSITKLDLDGTITFVNEFAQKFFDFTEAEILGRHIVGTIVPETDSAGQDLRTLIEGVVHNPDLYARYENENVRKNGDPVWVMWANRALFDEEGKVCGVLGIGTDITARKRAEDALRKSEQEKAAILDSLRYVAVEYLDPEMRVIWTNSATEYVFSLTPDELKGKKCYEAIHGLSEPCPGCTAIKALQTGEPHEGEIAKADGRTWMVSSNPIKDPSGKVTNVVHAAMNITARKLREEALRAEISERKQVEEMRRFDEARLEALWQLSQMTDSSTYQTARFALEQLVRLTKSEVGWIGFLDEAEAVLTVHSWQETPGHGSNGGSPVQIEVGSADVFADAIRERRVVVINDYPGPDPGSEDFLATNLKVARIMIVPVFENDRIVAIAGVGNKATEYDPSDARQVTLLTDGMWKIIQREKAEKDLRESESLAAMGRAMAAVAHDMKTPLIAIGGFACLAQKRINIGSPVQNLLEIVVKETQRMENMVKSMLDFSRPLELECSKGDIGQLVAECLALVAPMAKERKINLCSRLDSGVPAVASLDFMRMKQVLINLLTNAIQASQEGDDVIIGCETKGENLLINVIDYGCGIPPDKRQEIFSPFYTSKKEGTGLGLAIVKKIIEAHQGHIEISDNPGKGITFRVKIPIDLSSPEYPYQVPS
jgi:PAS domain S-box-containing protein